MKYVLLMVYLISNLACGRGPKPIDPAFKVYADMFEHYSQVYNNVQVADIRMEFGPEADNILGVCVIEDGYYVKIVINEKHWSSLKDYEKELVILHELGHCVMEKAHNDNKATDRKFESIMHSHPQILIDYPEHKDLYLKQFFAN